MKIFGFIQNHMHGTLLHRKNARQSSKSKSPAKKWVLRVDCSFPGIVKVSDLKGALKAS